MARYRQQSETSRRLILISIAIPTEPNAVGISYILLIQSAYDTSL